MKRVLIILAHPNLTESRINRTLYEGVKKKSNVTISELYTKYPDFNIDILKEQNLLIEADVIIFQHPVYWYNCPPLLKQWIDTVLLPGFAYGIGGDKLTGKFLLSAISADAAKKDYGPNGHNKYLINELLRPFELTANYCSMKYLDPFVIYETNNITDSKLKNLVSDYGNLIDSLIPQ